MAGSFCYKAPELHDKNLTFYNYKIDIWAAGLCLRLLLLRKESLFDSSKYLVYNNEIVADQPIKVTTASQPNPAPTSTSKSSNHSTEKDVNYNQVYVKFDPAENLTEEQKIKKITVTKILNKKFDYCYSDQILLEKNSLGVDIFQGQEFMANKELYDNLKKLNEKYVLDIDQYSRYDAGQILNKLDSI